MRRKWMLTATLFILLLAVSACDKAVAPDAVPTATPLPTNTPIPALEPTATSTPSPTLEPTATSTPAPTATPVPTSTPTPTATPTPVPTNTPTPVPTNTPTPISTATPVPTSTPTPTVTPVPTNTPTPTSTPTPTVTPTPVPTNTPTPVPTNTPTPVPTHIVPEGLPELVSRKNTIMEGTVLTSEEEANRYVFQMALDAYYRFGLLVEDLSMLHTAEEYLELFPEFISVELESLTEYRNGYFLVFSDLQTSQIDLAYRYALRTGDTSFLSDNEYQAYQKLFLIAEELNLAGLEDIDAIIAAHDYLVLNTAYDEAAAASGAGGASHYAEGLLLNGTAVCSGYASTFQLLMTFADIPCEYVMTDTHAWNLVMLDDEWYHMDVTWDDPVPDQPGTVIYTHFMMTDAEVATLKDHKNWHCECENKHDCDDERYRLYPYKNYICTNEEEASRLIFQQADSGQITLVYPNNGVLNDDILLQLAYTSLQLTGNISYFPADDIGDSHYLLRIILK